MIQRKHGNLRIESIYLFQYVNETATKIRTQIVLWQRRHLIVTKGSIFYPVMHLGILSEG